MEENGEKEEVIRKLLQRIGEENPDTFNYVIPNIFSKKIRSYMLIREDLKFAHDLTHKLIDLKSHELVDEMINSGLWYSIIIIYGKCYTQNDAGMSKLDEKDLFTQEDESLKKVHDELLYLRHSFIAHRDDTEKEQALVFMKVPKIKEIGTETEYQISSAKIVCPDIVKLKLYIELFLNIILQVESKIASQTQKVHGLLETFTAGQINTWLL